MPQYAEVILPLALPKNYTYLVPPVLQAELQVGMRVVVQFGKRRLYTALVSQFVKNIPDGFKPKEVLEIVDEQPIVGAAQLDLWKWMAAYYMCSMGEVMTAALPTGLKLESESVVMLNTLKKIEDDELTDTEYLIVEALQSQSALRIAEIAEIVGIKNPLRFIQSLLGKHYILLQEELKVGYRPTQKRFVKLASAYHGSGINDLFNQLERAPKQKELLLAYFQMQSPGNAGKWEPVLASKLLQKSQASDSSLKGLAERGFLEIYTDYFKKTEPKLEQKGFVELNPQQQEAYTQLQHNFETKAVNLLHGVTSSGKTEIYVRFIEQYLKQGKQVLYLVPEIALTTQLIGRLQKYFGHQVLVFHSRYSDKERVETWLKIVRNPNQPYLVIGARSSLFLPFQNLGFVIVDEEHETSYKQYDPAPRYHAKDTALVLAKMQKSKVLLGSATPSVESYTHALEGRYGLVTLLHRHGNLPLPEVQCVDLKVARFKKEMSANFSKTLIKAIEEVLKKGKQVILFQNRRGFSTYLQCQKCSEVQQCKNCDISLTYHKKVDLLKCHYCGFTKQVPQRCPACASFEVSAMGFGTEKIEDDLSLILPEARIKRMDLDTTRKKNAYQHIIEQFEGGEIDILIGTQMVTKGLDFENVALVGILNADSLLNYPDFRSHERAFQLMSQVSGRAGRKNERGQVLIQTTDPYHSIIRKVMDTNFVEMYKDEVYERKQYKYPPFFRLIKVTLKHRDQHHLHQAARFMEKRLKGLFGERILGPEFPLVARLRNMYQMEFLLKLEMTASPSKAKTILKDNLEQMMAQSPKHKVVLVFDVDPL